MTIFTFQGDYRWLSNFWPVPIKLAGMIFPSIENAYQAAKFPLSKRDIFTHCTAGQAKRLGRKASLPHNWNTKKLLYMETFVQQKFAPGTTLGYKLLSTHERLLIEGNHWGDTFWGTCNGEGENWLGKLIMKQRNKLQSLQILNRML